MNPQQFVTQLRESIIDENIALERRLFSEKTIEEATDPYFKRALGFYNTLSPEQREVLFEIIRQAYVDTISNVLGVIDGVCSFGSTYEPLILIVDGENIAGDLQDMFLANEQELAAKKADPDQ